MEKKSKQVIRTVDQSGTIIYTKDGKYHREDGPARIYANGTQIWYKNGKLHRKDGPAVIWDDGIQCWFKDGKEIKTNR